MIRCLALLALFFVPDSAIKHRLLEDGITKVPADDNYFTEKYREKYVVAMPENIEAGIMYVKSYYIDANNNWFEKSGQNGPAPSALLFYENGCVNEFSYNKNINLNPEVSGYRGVAFTKKSKALIEIIAPANALYTLGKYTYEYAVSGDTLFLYRPSTDSKEVYIKDKTGIKTDYTANW